MEGLGHSDFCENMRIPSLGEARYLQMNVLDMCGFVLLNTCLIVFKNGIH